jgi:aspartate/methionine/tyrosine aminotransferase
LFEEDAKEVSLELNSLSKSHNMAGWRLGWVSGNKHYVHSVLKVKSHIDSGIFLPVQHAAIEALKNHDKWHEERNNVLHKRREKVFELLKLLCCTYDENQVGMFVWAKVDTEITNGAELANKILYEANVFITPGFIFGSNGERYVRVSLCNKVENIEEAIKRIQNIEKNG